MSRLIFVFIPAISSSLPVLWLSLDSQADEVYCFSEVGITILLPFSTVLSTTARSSLNFQYRCMSFLPLLWWVTGCLWYVISACRWSWFWVVSYSLYVCSHSGIINVQLHVMDFLFLCLIECIEVIVVVLLHAILIQLPMVFVNDLFYFRGESVMIDLFLVHVVCWVLLYWYCCTCFLHCFEEPNVWKGNSEFFTYWTLLVLHFSPCLPVCWSLWGNSLVHYCI